MSWADDRDRRVFGSDQITRQGCEWYPSGEAETTLFDFLSMPLFDGGAVLERFRRLPGAIFREDSVCSKERFVYVPGVRLDRVVLVAHADTVFDFDYDCRVIQNRLYRDGSRIHSRGLPIGADDRAGCALLWLLRGSGHSLLIVDGEEVGCVGSRWLMESNPDIASEINAHSFMVQFDRMHGTDFKTYDVGTEPFKRFISDATGYSDAGADSFTDICELCRGICGVNLSVGYYDPHTFHEYLDIDEWMHTLSAASCLIEGNLPQFRF